MSDRPPFEGRSVLLLGGTGSFGRALLARLMAGTDGRPRRVVVYSRDELKQSRLRAELRAAGHDVELRLGDVRDRGALVSVLRGTDLVVQAAALKQVPSCEYAPWEAVLTNIGGTENLVRAIRAHDLPVETVVGISTDKACEPLSVMGMTKALQERLLTAANLIAPGTRFVSVRCGNVLGTRGSVVPLFRRQIRRGGPLTLTSREMTRFLMTLSQALDTIVDALRSAPAGVIRVPQVPSARMVDVAHALMGSHPLPIHVTGLRPGEKVHEVLVSGEEARRTFVRGSHLEIQPLLPELVPSTPPGEAWTREYSSADAPLEPEQTRALLDREGLVGPGTGDRRS